MIEILVTLVVIWVVLGLFTVYKIRVEGGYSLSLRILVVSLWYGLFWRRALWHIQMWYIQRAMYLAAENNRRTNRWYGIPPEGKDYGRK